IKVDDMEFGKYYALIIANQNYDNIEDLLTPYSDAKRAKKILEENFGFSVSMLLDADNTTVMKAINELNELVTEADNLLIFYAGHGTGITARGPDAGYWLHGIATPRPDDRYRLSHEFVTRHLARMQAKCRMVVADLCYSGLLSSAPGYLFLDEKVQYAQEYLR